MILYSQVAKRIANIIDEGSMIVTDITDMDKKRKFNYRYYTEQEWGKCQNYDLTLDSGSLGIDHCVDIIYHICQDDEVEKTPKPAEE